MEVHVSEKGGVKGLSAYHFFLKVLVTNAVLIIIMMTMMMDICISFKRK